ncbi:MAG: hypothetical protein H6658_05595 [Ardenticatenaceae bacterium]|nr:hypothetical protein [Ardenticatenaceae bacterium]
MNKVCHICQSDKIMPEVQIMDQGQYSDNKLKVGIDTKPQAILLKGWVQAQLKAWICGDCGHVELYVDNPQDLYKAYLRKIDMLTED